MNKKYKKIRIFFYETASTIVIDLNTKQAENWYWDMPMSIDYKTSDQCYLEFEDCEGKIHAYQGYVPDFFSGNHYGDYLMLSFSEKGEVKNFNPTDAEIEAYLKTFNGA